MPFLRDGNARADVVTHPLPALALGYGSEDVKAALQPVLEAMPDLDRLMFGVIRLLNAVHNCLGAIDCEVAMELNHGVCGISQVRFVPVDFGVVLSACAGCRQDDRQQREREEAAVADPKARPQDGPLSCADRTARDGVEEPVSCCQSIQCFIAFMPLGARSPAAIKL